MDLFKKCNMESSSMVTPNLVAYAKEKGIYPYFHCLESRQAPEVVMEGGRKIMLGSNNYLGLTANPEVIEAAKKALEKYGTGCSGSRFLNGTLDLHIRLESELASFLGAEQVMTFSTGFQSNLGIISTLVGRHDYILCDRENHASIYDGCLLSGGKLLRYKHGDMADLERLIKTVPETAGILIVTDGVFSMSGDIAKLPEIVAIKNRYGARLMVDDAHGLGVIGKGGRGTASYFGLEKDVDIIMGTFSKSLASLGGFMAASSTVCEFVRHNSRPFIFSASITPSSCAAALASLDILRREPERVERLNSLGEYLRLGMKKRGIKIKESTTPIVPVYTYELFDTLYYGKKLFENGVYINPVLPPATPQHECLLRISLMATHTEALLDEAMDIMKRVFDEGAPSEEEEL